VKRRVVVTGLGAVTPLGNTVQETWAGLCAGRSGIGPITRFDTAGFATRIAGELKNFDHLIYINKKEARRIDDFIIYALASAHMAMADAGLSVNAAFAERTGVVIGSAIGGLITLQKGFEDVLQKGPNRISPFTVPAILANLAAGHVSIRHGAKGPIGCPVMACAAGTTAIGDAFRTIAYDYADVVIAGGVDAAGRGRGCIAPLYRRFQCHAGHFCPERAPGKGEQAL